MVSKRVYRSILKSLVPVLALALLLANGFPAQAQSEVLQNQSKFGRLLRLIDGYYVDSANINELTEKAIVHMLSEMDPHSMYISKEEVQKMNEPLKGNFEGIGISFNIFKDTLLVLNTIAGGPSEKVGLRAGDRIVEVDSKNIAGIGLKTSDVFDLLRGKKGTKVNLRIQRKRNADLLNFVIIRDKIPIFSLDASYMLDETTGYIKLNRFSATTNDEFTSALKKLKSKGLNNLILDLRGNGGGYLKSAIEISDQFLPEKSLVVYTNGNNEPRREYRASSRGDFEKGNLVILVDEASASASEIVSGAVQDWDRGVIIGRRSFGKGLVQKPFYLTDGSMVRLTTAHYYTPSGRCIQKPFDEGLAEYRKDVMKRHTNGEMYSADSIVFSDSLLYKTLVNGRDVYGGGGVMPDIFVPIDTSHHYQYSNQLRRNNIIYKYVMDFVDSNRDKLKSNYPDFESFNNSFNVSDEMIGEIVAQGEEEGIEKNEESLTFTTDNIKKEVKAFIARDIFSRNDFYKVFLQDDHVLEEALKVFQDQNEYNHLLVTSDPNSK